MNFTLPTIMQILPRFNAGGVEQGTFDMAEGIIKQGWRAVIVSGGGQYVAPFVEMGGIHVTAPVYSKNPLMIWRNIILIQKICREQNVSLIHARSRAPAWSAYYASKKAKLPFVTTFHGAYGARGLTKKKYNAVMTKGDRVIAVSNYIKDYILDNYSMPEEKLVVIPRGIDENFFQPKNVSVASIKLLKEKWELSPDKKIIILPARMSRAKGHDVMIEAMAQLTRDDVMCYFVGNASGKEDYLAELTKFIGQCGLQDCVKIVDHENDMAAVYGLADLVVLPATEPESFGRVVAEALAMGVTTIASDIGGTKEILQNVYLDGLVEPNNPNALAELINKNLNNPGKIDTDFIWNHYRKQIMVDKEIDLYRKIISGEGYS
jgi:glycosyltransferase involved in cell wall biosynthesis